LITIKDAKNNERKQVYMQIFARTS